MVSDLYAILESEPVPAMNCKFSVRELRDRPIFRFSIKVCPLYYRSIFCVQNYNKRNPAVLPSGLKFGNRVLRSLDL